MNVATKWTTHRIAGLYYQRQALGERYDQLANDHKNLKTIFVRLVREPDNRYDKNAIRVVHIHNETYKETFLGWIPKEENVHMALMMDMLKVTFSGFVSLHQSSFATHKVYVDYYATFPRDLGFLDTTVKNTNSSPQVEPVSPEVSVGASSTFDKLKQNGVSSVLGKIKQKAAEEKLNEGTTNTASAFSDHELDI